MGTITEVLYEKPSRRMDVEVFLTSSNISEDNIRGRTVVVIDVLRACSTIVTALQNGARAVVPVEDMAQAGRIASSMDSSVYLLGGERGGKKIEGYHLGNSPHEYTRERVEGRDVIFSTSNGTTALLRARAAKDLLVGCFLNAERVVQSLKAKADRVTIVCAGLGNRISLEDTLCAGLLLYRLWDGSEPSSASDTAHIAFTQYLHDRDDMKEALQRSRNVRALTDKGHASDVDYCLQVDGVPVLPRFKDSRLVLDRNPAQPAASRTYG